MARTVVVNKHHVDQVVADYSTLSNKPQINSVTLTGNKTESDLRLNEEVKFRVKASGNISKGDICQINGGGTDYLDVVKATGALIASYPQDLIGVASSDIADGSYGYAVSIGIITGIDTSSASGDGTYIYYDRTNGGIRFTRPANQNDKEIIVGIVLKKDVNGSIRVNLDAIPTVSSISDVTISSISNGDFLQYNGSSNRWLNSTVAVFKTYAGFGNRTDSTIAVDGSGVVTLAPAVTSFVVYVNGTRKVLTNTQTVTVTADQTITYIYLDADGVLQKETSVWDITSGTSIPVAIVFKDGSTYSLTDERHGYERNKAWHNWSHMNIGTMYRSGLTGSFGNTTLSVTQGVIYDEDLMFDTGGTKTATSLWYRNATSGMRLVRGATACKSVSGGGVLQYDNGSGTLQDVSLNSYTTNWVYASNDATEPIYTVVGQNNSNTLTLARNTPAPTINLSTAEWKLIYKVIYRHTNGTPAGEFIESTDYRAVQTGVPTSSVITDHATLINRDASNSHPATAISYSTTNVGAELDARINKTYTLTIDVGEWTANSYSQVITGLTDNDLVLIQVPDSYYSTYGLSYTQSGDTITFTVTSTPLVSLTIGIGMVKCSAGGSL